MPLDVRTTGGVLRGVDEHGALAFRGIPYATLPVRWGAPERPRRWDGVRDADRFGPPPPQSAEAGAEVGAEHPDGWLTLNVWTPDLRAALPVMVWIPGGAYTFGHGALPEYDGRVLASAGVVLVTLSYRVGLEGFGYLKGLPPNRGLLDQVAALTWVRDNIAAFGGDPDRVTVFGQSAGGGSVAALLAMPSATGLFRRAVAQSVQGTFFTPALAADVTRECAAEVGVEPADLSTVDPWLLALTGDLVAARMTDLAGRWGPAARAEVMFAPVVDGEVLPTTPWAGLTGDVELMVGHTRDEQRLLTALAGDLGGITPDRAREDTEAFPDPGQRHEVVRSDWLFRTPSLKLAEAQVSAGGSAHLYELTWEAPGMGGALGACHGLDVPLVFGNLTAGQPAVLLGGPTVEAVELSALMRAAWVGFATTGDPGWPGFDTGAVRLFDLPPVTTAYPEQVSREIWTDPPGALDLLAAP